MGKEVGEQGAGRREARKGLRERCFRSTISMEWSSPRHLGMRGTRRAWNRQQSGTGKFIGSQSHRKKPSESKRLICKQHRTLHTAAAAANPRTNLDLLSVARTFGQHQSPQPCESQPNLDELYY